MLARALVVLVLLLAVELPVAADPPPAAPATEPDQIDRAASRPAGRRRPWTGERRDRRARRTRRAAAKAAAGPLVIREGLQHDPADGDDVPPPEAGRRLIVGKPGQYQGVRPGKVVLPPHPPKAADRPFLTWAGFMMTEQGSRVFLQFTQPVQYTVTESAREIVLMAKGARIHMRNNARMVNTRYFATPVARVQARQQGKDVRVTIALRKPAKPEHRLEAGEQGFHFLMLDFPPTGEAPLREPTSREAPSREPPAPVPDE